MLPPQYRCPANRTILNTRDTYCLFPDEEDKTRPVVDDAFARHDEPALKVVKAIQDEREA